MVAIAWKALNDMNKIWKSDASREIKLDFCQSTVETVLLYGCEAWTLTEDLQKELDGCYTRMLQAVLNISWEQKVPNKILYGKLPKVSDKVASKRMQLAGHCYCHPELATSNLILWEPTRGCKSRGQKKTYIEVLKEDTNDGENKCESVAELGDCMRNRDEWRRRVEKRHKPP